jgi:hypothetical protein
MPLHPRRNPDAARTIVGRVCDLTDTPAFATKSKADETVRAYRHDFAAFEVFCAANGHPSMPATPAAVAEFLASEQARGCKASTLTRRVASIRYRHKLNGHQSPTDDETARAGVVWHQTCDRQRANPQDRGHCRGYRRDVEVLSEHPDRQA